MKILIVEDSTLELGRISRMVHELLPEAEILSFSDSSVVEKEILQGTIPTDLAFLDVEMPDPDGIHLAKLLVEKYPKVNIIFTTAYSSYMEQAFGLFASGYLLKPFSLEDIKKQIENLRHPPMKADPVFFARTIGEFDFFCSGKPVIFSLARSKEALAYLIDRQGVSITKRELFSVLFEDQAYTLGKQDHMKKIMRSLKDTLQQYGGGDILLHSRNSYAVDMNKITTDQAEVSSRKGVPYMEQYSWADGWQV